MRTRASALLCYKELLKALTRNKKGGDQKHRTLARVHSGEGVYFVYIALGQPLTLVI